VRRYQRPIIGFIARMLGQRGDPALAEDLAQETFVKAFQKLAAFDTSRRLSSWLFRIAHNTTVDAIRRARPPIVAMDAAAPELRDASDDKLPADLVERKALGRALEEALAALRPEYRAAIVLRYEDGLPFSEIAHVLGVPEVTARTHVHRARRQLAGLLAGSGWKPGPTGS
jgi:RNA polymerase sigma-70 factor (ECF subfamily)